MTSIKEQSALTQWTVLPLGDAVKPTRPRIKPAMEPDLPFIGMEHVEAHTMKLLGTVPAATMKSSAVHFQPGDVLYGRLRPYLNKVYRPDFEGLCSAEFIVFPKTEGIDSRYLQYFLNSSAFVSFASHLNTGDRPRVDFEQLAPYPFPLAPSKEQERIVAEIEKQFSRLDEAVANLKRVKANFKRYKSSVLKAAVEGKLTEDWRLSARAEGRRRAQASELETIPKAGKEKWFIYIIECNEGSYYVGHTADLHARWQAHCEGSGADWTRQHPPKYLIHFEECGSREDAVKREKDLKTGFGRTWRKREIDAGRMKPLVHNPANETALPVHDEGMQTGSKLLEHILAERRAKWNGKGKYKEPEAPDVTGLPSHPKDWTWVRLEQLGVTVGGLTKNPKRAKLTRKLPYLRVANVYANELRLDAIEHIGVQDSERDKLLLRKGDLLVVEGNGSKDQIGRLAIWDGSIDPCVHQNHLIKVRLVVCLMNKWVLFWLLSPVGRHFIEEVSSSTSGLYTLSVNKVGDLPIIVPPLAEQEQIIADVERRLSIIDELEASVDANLTRADRLRQSVLRKSFSG